MAKKQEFGFVDSATQVIQKPSSLLSQGFTIGTTGDNVAYAVSEIMLKIQRIGNPGRIFWQIEGTDEDGNPNREVYSKGEITEDEVDTTEAVFISSQALNLERKPLSPDTKYALTLRVEDPDGATDEYKFGTSSMGDGTYLGGNINTSSTFGATWGGEIENYDFIFSINGEKFEGTLCSIQEIINKAGKNANNDSLQEAVINNFVRQAEDIIAAVTRFDWVTKYPDLNDNTKRILSQVCSDIAATYVITYDMSGYTDRVEAETMINVYRETIVRGLSLLKKQEVRAFILKASEE